MSETNLKGDNQMMSETHMPVHGLYFSAERDPGGGSAGGGKRPAPKASKKGGKKGGKAGKKRGGKR
ncbi:MAG TPA: hypothetical protein VKF81_09925 [Blastocatellia bacterium]|nr:hypothetical protein [Blastocatellia bacterium]